MHYPCTYCLYSIYPLFCLCMFWLYSIYPLHYLCIYCLYSIYPLYYLCIYCLYSIYPLHYLCIYCLYSIYPLYYLCIYCFDIEQGQFRSLQIKWRKVVERYVILVQTLCLSITLYVSLIHLPVSILFLSRLPSLSSLSYNSLFQHSLFPSASLIVSLFFSITNFPFLFFT